jgi:hypothetical protein
MKTEEEMSSTIKNVILKLILSRGDRYVVIFFLFCSRERRYVCFKKRSEDNQAKKKELTI